VTYAIVARRPFSASTGLGPVRYLTGAFAGTGGFTVSPIRGNPSTASAGLSVKGHGASHDATLFVMTTQISNAPNVGFTHAGVLNAVTMRNPAVWYGRAGGAASKATPTSPANAVPTINETPVAGFALNNPIKAGHTTISNKHPARFLNAYLGRVMVVAVPSTTSFATPAKSPSVGNGGGGIAASAGSFFHGDPSKMSPLHSVIGGPLILNGTGGYLGSWIFPPRKP
jgi:hypothetical protein